MMSKTVLWILFWFGVVAGSAVMAISFQSYAEGDAAIFLRGAGLVALGISAYYFKLIRDARRLEARQVDAKNWPAGLRIYCDPRASKRLVWTLVWIIVMAVAQAVLRITIKP
jgi:hypothetical protein